MITPPPCTDTGAIEASNNVDCESTPVNPIADMAIVKNASQSQVGAGGGFNWVLDVTNNGPSTANAVVVGDIVPSQLTVTGVSSSQFSCTHAGNSVTCTKASMAVGETGQVTIAVSVPSDAASGTVVNIGTVEATTPDRDLTNNSDDASVTLVAQAPPTTTLPPVVLPPTGSNATTPVTRAAFMLVLLGGFVISSAVAAGVRTRSADINRHVLLGAPSCSSAAAVETTPRSTDRGRQDRS